MTSTNTENPAAMLGEDDNLHYSPKRGLRRRRSPRRLFKRRWFRPKRLLRASFMLLLPAAFMYVSLKNDVLGPSHNWDGSIQVVKTRALEATSPVSRLELPTPDDPSVSDSDPVNLAKAEPTVHEVLEGGSLWRTGRRFISDEVLLDKLIDNLAERGMDVGNVRAGVQFLVSDLDSEGLLVVIEARGRTYESHVHDNEVVTTVRRFETDNATLLNTAALDQEPLGR